MPPLVSCFRALSARGNRRRRHCREICLSWVSPEEERNSGMWVNVLGPLGSLRHRYQDAAKLQPAAVRVRDAQLCSAAFSPQSSRSEGWLLVPVCGFGLGVWRPFSPNAVTEHLGTPSLFATSWALPVQADAPSTLLVYIRLLLEERNRVIGWWLSCT